MKLLLTSAGLTNQKIEQALNNLIGKPNNECMVAFIPTAANIEKGSKEWLIDNYIELKKQDYKSIDIVDISALSKDIWLPRLQKADVIFIGGGDTFFLMAWLKKSGLDNNLQQLLKTRVYVGISAGSIVATTDLRMSTSSKISAKDIYPLESIDGLKLVDFHIRPHFNSKNFPKLTTDNIKKMAKDIIEPVYAIDDNTAISINNGKTEIISEGKWIKIK